MGVTTGAVVLSATLSWKIFLAIGMGGADAISVTLWNWLETESLSLNFGVWVDKLTAVMLIVVTTVSACVHLYSYSYMEHDASKPRFFAYLSLFTFAMLALVMAPNLLQMFLGWEGVGVASYLLIGFWYKKESANAASIKAFVTNRVADVFLLFGLFMLFWSVGSLEYATVFGKIADMSTYNYLLFGYEVSLVELSALFLFLGAMGKSAQLGFHVWLPDAMEGPTPVSALIHAATMVTAGVFLLCRMSPLFEAAPQVLTFVAYVGALTAIFAATIGLTQKDIKRVIAYSTCSQLGYMFFAIGVSAYPAAMFHLTTHAFFKALLFLGAGSVIHALHHEQNLFKMGGLKTVLPFTYGMMWLGSLALAGIPPFAGFFSKDLILESAFGAQNMTGYTLYALGTVGALMTAFYSFRVLFLTFHQTYKGSAKARAHAHEGPWQMRLPLFILAIGAVVSGFFLKDMGVLEWWQGSIVIAEGNMALHNAHHTPWLPKYAPLAVVLVGILLAVVLYLKKPKWPALLAKKGAFFYKLSLHKWYVDELYGKLFITPFEKLALVCGVKDKTWLDACLPHGAAWLSLLSGKFVRKTQTGLVYHYAFATALGVCALMLWVMYGGWLHG